jgi:hypothetical protein
MKARFPVCAKSLLYWYDTNLCLFPLKPTVGWRHAKTFPFQARRESIHGAALMLFAVLL